MKALVVYYSRTGNTRKAGEDIARELGCDAEEIVDTVNRAGPVGYILSGKQATLKELTKLKPMAKDPSQYDLVIIGTPVWAATMSSPVRTFIAENKEKLKSVAFFATMGNVGDASAIDAMGEACDKKPRATLALTARDIKSGAHIDAVKKFAASIKE